MSDKTKLEIPIHERQKINKIFLNFSGWYGAKWVNLVNNASAHQIQLRVWVDALAEFSDDDIQHTLEQMKLRRLGEIYPPGALEFRGWCLDFRKPPANAALAIAEEESFLDEKWRCHLCAGETFKHMFLSYLGAFGVLWSADEYRAICIAQGDQLLKSTSADDILYFCSKHKISVNRQDVDKLIGEGVQAWLNYLRTEA